MKTLQYKKSSNATARSGQISFKQALANKFKEKNKQQAWNPSEEEWALINQGIKEAENSEFVEVDIKALLEEAGINSQSR